MFTCKIDTINRFHYSSYDKNNSVLVNVVFKKVCYSYLKFREFKIQRDCNMDKTSNCYTFLKYVLRKLWVR